MNSYIFGHLRNSGKLPAETIDLAGVTISFGMGGQDVLVANMIGPALTSFKTGTYLDIGCGHERFNSNTKIFSQMGWSGVAVDMHPLGDWDQRPNCRLIRSALIDKSFENREYIEAFIHPSDSFFSTINPKTQERHISHNNRLRFDVRNVKTIDVETLIEQTREFLDLKVNSLDFLSIDVEEGLTPDAYAKLIEGLKPKVVLVECGKNQFQPQELLSLKSFSDLECRMSIFQKSWELSLARALNYKLINVLGYDLFLVSSEFSPNLGES